MTAAIDFYFDFTSPYGYIAAEKIEAFATQHGRSVNWHPVLLGAIFKITGTQPLVEIPLKGNYSKRDFARTARFLGVPFNFPARFPVSGVAASRVFYVLAKQSHEHAKAYAQAVFRAYFREGRDISSPDVALDLAAAQAHDRAALAAAINEPLLKEEVKRHNDHAIEVGVFGSPYFVIDGEPFWGCDRFDQMERWLAQGPF